MLEQIDQAAPPERDAAAIGSAHSALHLGDNAFRTKLLEQSRYRPDLEVASHDRPDPLDLLWHRHQLALDHLIAERYRPAHPQALLLRSSDLVADALPGDFALELDRKSVG